ncbi:MULTISPECIES: helix-turn-helix transcriptional regulator [unclassified Streptomyces]|uniref:helix-turn-helix transcriptional regulator n=1 Tax=unclassified Streptomyces TaxID=2593676 RepID=UPI000DB9A6C9|nr:MULTISPECIES: helix-turn-helix transcriptional regulator [unclassified Streptomyces]MYT73147.1 helix-turn-helix domain-containing protein [Streptomyces sp. SID8367]RAJ73608.1 helix-turn-helix protein [Streptomyces sp. PsTaAH-137]
MPSAVAVPAASADPTSAELRRAELAAFLRSRRERITPDRVGLPGTARRRTPGLRREEVAHLAAVGVTWYTWLEQGRAINVSAGVLDAIARALLLDPAERAHAFALAGATDPRAAAESPAVTPTILRMLRRLEPYPAELKNARYEMLAHNRAHADVFGAPEESAPEHRSALWGMFMNDRWRTQFLDLDAMRRDLVAKYRKAMAEHVGEPAWRAPVDALLAVSPEFRELWERRDVAPVVSHVKRYLHPDPAIGLLRLEHRHMWLAPDDDAYRVVAYLPADDETEERLEALALSSASSSAG